jgi:hypothetical protein
MRTAKSCGPDTPTLVSSFVGVARAQPGGDVRLSTERPGQDSPVPGEITYKLLKPSRGECRMIPVPPL